MTSIPISSATRFGKGRAALLAALPHLVVALLMALSAATAYRTATSLAYGAFLLLSAGMLLFAWRQHWPLWSGSWLGNALLFLPAVLSAQLPVPFELLFFALLFVGLFRLLRRPLLLLLASLPPTLLLTHVYAFELVAGGEWIWSAIWLLLGLVTAAVVLAHDVRAGALLVVGFQIVAGLSFALGRLILPFRFPDRAPPRVWTGLQSFLNEFAPLTLVSITLPLALLLLAPLIHFARAGGRAGKSSWRLLLLGVLMALGGFFALRALPPLQSGGGWDATVVAAGVALVAGLLLALGAGVRLSRAVANSRSALLLATLAALAPLVIFALPHPFAQDGTYSRPFQIQVMAGYAGVLTWILLVLFSLFRIDLPPVAADSGATG